ncbi:hypothetical protein LAZ67_20002728 [Cordylochernes scorpioides]|uniref:Mos1 transposase HTH domain-containing protein n=1 Tax=Cordylochernes scorpioides TaxID=51811 RepID=A0ABY6LKW7_9ARAC|nr:hypothetical protein LAZ67_20002728 [Cordylochernes scorpioides]
MSPKEIYEDMVDTLREDVPSYSTVKKWVAAFKLGRISTKDEHRPGRPVESVTQDNIDKIHYLVMLDRRMTVRQIEETLSIPKTTVDWMMKIVYHQDNAQSHRSLQAMAAIYDSGFELLPHAPYSPDHQSDFHLLPHLTKSLSGIHFRSNEENFVIFHADLILPLLEHALADEANLAVGEEGLVTGILGQHACGIGAGSTTGGRRNWGLQKEGSNESSTTRGKDGVERTYHKEGLLLKAKEESGRVHVCSFRKIQIVENFWSPWKMAISEPKSAHLREVLLFTFNWKKSATEAHRIHEEVYGDHALSKSQCYRWFKKFQSGDFELDNEPRGKPPQKFEDAELQALLDEDSTQMQEKLAKQL